MIQSILVFVGGLAAQKYLGLGDRIIAFVKNLISPPSKVDAVAARQDRLEQSVADVSGKLDRLIAGMDPAK